MDVGVSYLELHGFPIFNGRYRCSKTNSGRGLWISVGLPFGTFFGADIGNVGWSWVVAAGATPQLVPIKRIKSAR